MSLKDLLGLFDSDKKQNQSNYLNVSLAQGVNFNNMQAKIEGTVEPQLSLIEQTTSPNLGSIVENFSGNTTEAPLNKVNTKEYKQLQSLEDDFNKALSKYTQKQNAMMTAAQHATRGKGWDWNDIKDNIMWQGEKSPADCEKACNADSNCTGWEAKGDGSKCYLINKSNIAPPSSGRTPEWTAALANRELQGTQKAQMDAMFNNLQQKAKTLQQQTMALHAQHQRLAGSDGDLSKQKASTMKQLQELQTRNARLDRLMAEGDTLSAEIQDNRLQMDSAYMRYFVWLGAAITLGLVAVHKAAK